MLRSATIILSALLCLQAMPAYSAAKKAPRERKAQAGHVYISLTPADGSLINNAKPTISAEYVDEGAGVNPIDSKLYVDGVEVTSTAQASPNKINYSPSTPLADGTHKVSLAIDDKAGNPSAVEWSFSVRTQAPKVKITSLKQNQFVNQSPLLVSGSVDEARSRVYVNGIAAVVARGAFSAKVNIVEGNNTITAVATDSFGNSGNDSLIIVLDSKPPMIEITEPGSNNLINAKTVTIRGLVDKNAATVTVSAHAGARGVPAELGVGGFTVNELKLEEGVNTIVARAVSQAGNIGTSSVKVTVDSIPPRVTITSPKNMAITNKRMMTVIGTVDDPTAAVKVNNTPVQVSRGAFSLSGVNLSEGSNTITVTATDRAGNQAKTSTITVALDTTPPAAPSLNATVPVTRTAAMTITGTSEPGSQVEVFMNSGSKGTVKADEKGAFTLKVALTEGNNAVTAIAYDAIGNASAPSSALNVFLDTKPPKIL